MRRGDIVIFAAPGDYSSKPRPAVIVQSDRIAAAQSVVLCLLSSEADVTPEVRRISVPPTTENGLLLPSQIMVEKLLGVKRSRCGPAIGKLESEIMDQLDAALSFVLGLAD